MEKFIEFVATAVLLASGFALIRFFNGWPQWIGGIYIVLGVLAYVGTMVASDMGYWTKSRARMARTEL